MHSLSPRYPRPTAAIGLAIVLIASLLVALTPTADAAAPATATVDLTKVAARTDPYAIGVGSSTYGANPLSSPAQAAAERRLDARTVRIPVGYRNGKVTSSAAGSGGSLDVPALVRTYRSWGYRVIVVIGGRTNDVDVQPGDTTRIIQALGFDGITYTAPNEPGNHGKTLADQTALAAMIINEGRAIRADFRLTGPVWAWYDRAALTGFASAIGDRLGGLDYHHYAMGERSLTTAQAMAETPVYGREVSTLRSDLQARGLDVPVIVDELNFSWRYQDGTPGGNNRFFTAVNTVWMTSVLGHILKAGGRGLPYATQNGPLGVMVEAGQVNPDGRPVSSPMPAYWAIANWTGGGRWSHFQDTVYASSSSDPNVEAFAVNNEAGGYNLLLLNKDWADRRNLSLKVTGARAGQYTAYRGDHTRPYDAPAAGPTTAYGTDPTLAIDLPPMTVTVLVMRPGATGPTSPPASPTPPSTTPPSSAPTTTPSTTAPSGLTASRSTDGTRATITWSAPTTTNGTITGYRVARDGTDTTGGGAYATTLSASSRTFSFTLLRPATAYTFSVHAVTTAGNGPAATVRVAGR